MILNDWFMQQYDGTIDLPDNLSGEELVVAFCRCLASAGFNFDQQIDILLKATDVYYEVEFYRACIEQIKNIRRLQDERREVLNHYLGKCANGVSARKATTADGTASVLRFAPCWPPGGETCDIVDDMLLRMAEAGYLESDRGTLRTLRQGFGYYRRGEEPCAERRPVRWLSTQNALHWWLCALFGDHGGQPLICDAEGSVGRWITAATIFADRNGRPFTNAQLEHGRPASDAQRRWLDDIVPLRPVTT